MFGFPTQPKRLVLESSRKVEPALRRGLTDRSMGRENNPQGTAGSTSGCIASKGLGVSGANRLFAGGRVASLPHDDEAPEPLGIGG